MIVRYLVSYIATAVVFFGLDFIWLSSMTSRFYRARLGDLLLDRPRLGVAGVFYLVYVGGIVIFAVGPALNAGSWFTAMLLGAILGLISYGTYDFTNLSTLRQWSAAVSVVDILWGIFLTAISATFGYWIVERLIDN
jgi:uncharacterized membrane protein